MDEIRDAFLSIRLGLARAVSRIVPPHEVEDIVQETYVRLCMVGKAEHIEHAKSYIFKTARNLALDSVKRAENRLSEHCDEIKEVGYRQSRVLIDQTGRSSRIDLIDSDSLAMGGARAIQGRHPDIKYAHLELTTTLGEHRA